jgi:DNA repair protein RadC
MPTLYVRQANGRYAIARRPEIAAAAAELIQYELQRGSVLSRPQDVTKFLKLQLQELEHELFCMLILDNRHRLIEFVTLFRGTIDGASVHPREVVKEVLARNGAAVIFAHNHPSGIAVPSDADRIITRRLKAALELIDVRVLDHIVIGHNEAFSMAELGQF